MTNNITRFAVSFLPALAIMNTLVVFKIGIDVRPFIIIWPLFLIVLLSRGVNFKGLFEIRFQDVFLLLFLISCGLSSVLSDSARSLIEYVQLIYFVSIYFVMRYIFENENVLAGVYYLIRFSVVMLVFAIISYIVKAPIPSVLEVGVDGVFFSEYSGIDLIRGFRVSVFGLGPVLTAAVFLVLFIFSFVISFKNSSLLWLLRLGILIAIFLTDSRAAFAIAFVFIVLYGAYSFAGLISLFSGVLIILVLGVIFYDEISYRLLYRFGEVDYSTLYHLAVWDSAYWIFDSNKLFGVGLGEFIGHWIVPEFHKYYSLSFNDIDPHNIFLKLMAETGALGTACFGLFILSIIIKTNWSDKNSLLISFGFGAFLLMNMTMNAFFVEFFWCGVALCAANKRDFGLSKALPDDLTADRNVGEYR